MNKLFIYYSLSGNGDLIAEELANFGFEIRKVIEKHKPSKVFFFRILGGGFRAGLNLKGKLIDYNNDVSHYEEIIIGSPIWNGRLAPAINRVLSITDLKGRKLTFVLYSGSGAAKKAVKKINKLYPKVRIIILKEPKSHPEELDKIKELGA